MTLALHGVLLALESVGNVGKEGSELELELVEVACLQ